MDQAGFPLKPFDFRVPGVTSISCDSHKVNVFLLIIYQEKFIYLYFSMVIHQKDHQLFFIELRKFVHINFML